MSYFVYILKSEKNEPFYKGMTNNIERRLKEHNDLKVKYSRAHAPWKLVLTIEKEDKTEALQLER